MPKGRGETLKSNSSAEGGKKTLLCELRLSVPFGLPGSTCANRTRTELIGSGLDWGGRVLEGVR